MDHSEAVGLKATERYLLHELSPEQLEQFEEHLFDCQDCAIDLRAAAMFLEQTKNILCQPQKKAVAVKAEVSAGRSWFAWLRPALIPQRLTLVSRQPVG